MKKGKTSKLSIFDDAKCYYGTVDSKNLKTIYIDLRTSGLQKNKKSFLNLEITLFIHNHNFDFKSLILRSKLKKIISHIYFDDLKKSKYFILSKTKTKQLVEL
jgi:hypothetical protein